MKKIYSLLLISCLATTANFLKAQNCSTVNAGSISSAQHSYNFCEGDELADNVSVSYTNKTGPNSRILLIDNATIIAIFSGDQSTVNFEGNQSFSTGYFRGIAYENGLTGLAVGQSINNLAGCYALSSNTVFVSMQHNKIGTITMEGATSKEVCVSDGKADLTKLTFVGTLSTAAIVAVIDANNNIVSQAFDLPNLEGTGAGTVRFVVLGSCDNEGTAIPNGTNLNNLPAQVDVSQILSITKVTGCGVAPPVCTAEQKSCPGKVLMCVNNVSTCVATKQVNKLLAQGATRGGCIRCTTSSQTTTQEDRHLQLAYPNPSHGQITINSGLKGAVKYELYNQSNEKIWEAILDDSHEDRSLNFSGLNLKPGSYLIRMLQRTTVKTQRLVFE
jgi:hypothetical protein